MACSFFHLTILVFFSSAECQRFDWVTHKANCDNSKTQKSGDDDTKALDSIAQTTGRKYKTVNCKNKLHKLTQNEEQDTNIKHSVQNCQVSSSEINLDPQERFLGHNVQVETIQQQTKTVKMKNVLIHMLENEIYQEVMK